MVTAGVASRVIGFILTLTQGSFMKTMDDTPTNGTKVHTTFSDPFWIDRQAFSQLHHCHLAYRAFARCRLGSHYCFEVIHNRDSNVFILCHTLYLSIWPSEWVNKPPDPSKGSRSESHAIIFWMVPRRRRPLPMDKQHQHALLRVVLAPSEDVPEQVILAEGVQITYPWYHTYYNKTSSTTCFSGVKTGL